MSTIELKAVSRDFGSGPVVENVSLEVKNGELLALLGRSGSGKTTLLRIIAGFEAVNAGRVLLGGEDVTGQDALGRRCGMVFQHYALFPHLTVGENVGYGLADQSLTRSQTDARVAGALEMVDLAGLERRSVSSLSGGQQQRVALARALAPRPGVLLLDEPLSNLDPTLRERTREELRELIRRVGITTVLVTHEQEEAFDLADRVAVLHQGHLQQIAAPEILYHHPVSPFVAGFIGHATRLEGRIALGPSGENGLEAEGIFCPGAAGMAIGSIATAMIRPEALRFAPDGELHGVVRQVRFAGAVSYCAVELSPELQIKVSAPHGPQIGEAVKLQWTGGGVHLFPGVSH